MFARMIVFRLNASRYAAFLPAPSSGFYFIDSSGAVSAYLGATIPIKPTAPPPPSGTPGAALGRTQWTLSASSTWEYAPLDGAIDASLGSHWSTNGAVAPGATSFTIDTHASQTVGSLRVNDSQMPNDMPLAGNVLVSTDGTTYTQVAQWNTGNIVGGILDVSWTATTARYVKLVATQVPAASGNAFSIGDVRLYASFAEVLFTGSASGSSYYDPTAYAFDNNVGTRWGSGVSVTPNSTFFTIDSHTTGSFSSLRLDDSQFLNDLPTSGDVLVSTNGSTFTRVAQWTTANIASGVLTLSWTAVPARYVKLVATSTPISSGNWFSIGEVVVQ